MTGKYFQNNPLANTFRLKLLHLFLASPRVHVDPGPTFVNRGEDAILPSCHVIGFPAPVITWAKVLGKLPRGRTLIRGHSLTITRAEKEDAGSYICKATSSGGSSRAVTQLVVTVVPRFTVTPMAVIETFAGTSVGRISPFSVYIIVLVFIGYLQNNVSQKRRIYFPRVLGVILSLLFSFQFSFILKT